MLLSKKFLKSNKDLILIPADKGGKVVIMDKSTYEQKMNDHIEECVRSHTYFPCKEFVFTDVRNLVEEKYKILKLNPYLAKDAVNLKTWCTFQLKNGSYVIPLLYGYPKPHKEGIPIRPIISSLNMLGDDLSFWLLKKLQKIATHFNKYNVTNTVNLIRDIRYFKLEMDHRLTTWDYSSMFTNIPVLTTIKIVEEFYYLIEDDTCLPVELFIEAIKFFTIDSTYFMY